MTIVALASSHPQRTRDCFWLRLNQAYLQRRESCLGQGVVGQLSPKD
jgi:hypothetical protein